MATFYTQATSDTKRASIKATSGVPGPPNVAVAQGVAWFSYSYSVTPYTTYERKESSYTRFQVSSLPQGSSVTDAKVRYDIYNIQNEPGLDFDLRIRAKDSSNPGTITTFTGIMSPTGLASASGTFIVTNSVYPKWEECSVTTLVQELVDSYDYTGTKHMLMFLDQSSKAGIGTASSNTVNIRHHGQANPPELVITFTNIVDKTTYIFP